MKIKGTFITENYFYDISYSANIISANNHKIDLGIHCVKILNNDTYCV